MLSESKGFLKLTQPILNFWTRRDGHIIGKIDLYLCLFHRSVYLSTLSTLAEWERPLANPQPMGAFLNFRVGWAPEGHQWDYPDHMIGKSFFGLISPVKICHSSKRFVTFRSSVVLDVFFGFKHFIPVEHFEVGPASNSRIWGKLMYNL